MREAPRHSDSLLHYGTHLTSPFEIIVPSLRACAWLLLAQ